MIIINHFYYLYVYVCADIKKKFCCFPIKRYCGIDFIKNPSPHLKFCKKS